MFGKLEILQLSGDMARHASARQVLISRNVANANTPGYRSLDIGDFEPVRRANSFASQMNRSRPGHLGVQEGGLPEARTSRERSGKPNGNAVSLETELVRAAEVRHRHQMAMSVYGASLDFLRASIGRR